MKVRKWVKTLPWDINLKYGSITDPIHGQAWFATMLKLKTTSLLNNTFGSTNFKNCIFKEEI